MLFRQGINIPLPSKTFEVLLYLLANSGRVVSKDELLKQVWPDSFVEEGNLTQHVFRLRKALQPQPDDAPCIITIPGQGYQFSPVVESALSQEDKRDYSLREYERFFDDWKSADTDLPIMKKARGEYEAPVLGH